LAIERRAGYRDMRNNMTLARAFGDALAGLGRCAPDDDPDVGAGSTDMGDVSQEVPSIHPYLAICARGETMCHEHAFAAHAASDQGVAAMLDAARAMALTTQRFLSDADLRATVRAEFERGS